LDLVSDSQLDRKDWYTNREKIDSYDKRTFKKKKHWNPGKHTIFDRQGVGQMHEKKLTFHIPPPLALAYYALFNLPIEPS
jgi:hypothetical protein